jgi:2-dehydro-3-deoxygluconokinase
VSNGLNIPQKGDLDLLSLGALVHRLDPGIVPFRKATECRIHVSGGEFNVAANLADCFRMRTGIASAMVDYPIGDLIAERVRAMGVKPFYRPFKHNGVNGPNMATVFSDGGFGVRAPVVFYNRSMRPPLSSNRETSTGRRFLQVACAGSTAVEFSPHFRKPPAS